MKVICVKSPDVWQLTAMIFGGSYPEVGDECTVVGRRLCACGKHDKYSLSEHMLFGGFDERCFATLPEADADEIETAEKEAIVPNPNL